MPSSGALYLEGMLMTDTKDEPVKPCRCGNPRGRGDCMKIIATRILNLPVFREVLGDPAEDGDGRDHHEKH